jgi:hypothetical protein
LSHPDYTIRINRDGKRCRIPSIETNRFLIHQRRLGFREGEISTSSPKKQSVYRAVDALCVEQATPKVHNSERGVVKGARNSIEIRARAICMRNERTANDGETNTCRVRDCRGEFVVTRYAPRTCTHRRTRQPRTTIYFDRRGIGLLRNDTSARHNIDFIGPLRHILVSRPKRFSHFRNGSETVRTIAIESAIEALQVGG